MPTPVTTVFADGDQMGGTVVTALEAVEAVLNGGLGAADVVVRSIPWVAVAAPKLIAYPYDAFDGEFYYGTCRIMGLPAMPAPMNDVDLFNATAADAHNCPTARQIPRHSVFPGAISGGDATPIPPMAVRVDVDTDDSVLQIEVHATIPVLADDVWGSFEGRQGNLDIRYRRVEDDSGTWLTGIAGTERTFDSRIMQQHVNTIAQVVVDRGTYDVWVTYQRGAANSAVWQLVVLDAVIDVDVYKGGA